VSVAVWWCKKAVLNDIFLRNIATEPTEHFVLSPEDYASAKTGER
jgi:hypothetical protein